MINELSHTPMVGLMLSRLSLECLVANKDRQCEGARVTAQGHQN